MTSEEPDDGEDVVRESFDTEQAEPGIAVVETVAELREVDPTELSSIYACVDHVIDHVFSEPPAPEAQVEVSFSYEGYRITIHQDGIAEFRLVGSAPDQRD